MTEPSKVEVPPAILLRYKKIATKRKRIMDRLQVTLEMIKNLPNNKEIFLVRAERLPETFTEFNGVLDELDSVNCEQPTRLADADEWAAKFETMYYSILAAAKAQAPPPITADQSINTSFHQVEREPKARLPDLPLPCFDGKFENFDAFHSLFNNLVHKSKLSDIEKFSYLLKHVDGTALQLVKTVEFRPENYQTVYKLLVDRYTNKRVIANFYLNKLLNLEAIKNNSANFRQATDTIVTTVTSIKSLAIPNLDDFILLYLSLRLLDSKTRKVFEDKHLGTDFPTFEHFRVFMFNQTSVSDLLGETSYGKASSSKERKPNARVLLTNDTSPGIKLPTAASTSLVTTTPSLAGCPCCSNTDHKLSKCEKFLAMSVAQRKDVITKKRLCYACFGHHAASQCKSTFSCRQCQRKSHNSLIHPEPSRGGMSPSRARSSTSSVTPNTAAQDSNSVTLANICPKLETNHQAILGTARVSILDVAGKPHPCRVVMDTGSQANFITSTLADCLGLPRSRHTFTISGIGQSTVHPTVKGKISCKLASLHDLNSSIFIETSIIPRITSDLPTVALPAEVRSKFSQLSLADPDFDTPGPVDLLLGVQAVLDATSVSEKIVKGRPCAVPTIFGYVIMGSVPVPASPIISSSLLSVSAGEHSSVEDNLDCALKLFWEQEEVNIPRPMSIEDERCERHFRSTISRQVSGRYIARLPFKSDNRPTLGNIRDRAFKRLYRLEQQLDRNPNLRGLYAACLQDYVDQGHMVRAEKPSDYVMTHHGVVKGSQDNLKVRVVFNPSEKDPNGISLNDTLLVGPKKQGDIGEIISRFRTHPIAVKCDVRQMYRAIALHPEDQDYLHFLWRFSPADPITEWKLTTVTFGVASSPFTAQSVMAQLAHDEGHKFPLAARALQSETFVDDITTGASSIDDAKDLCGQLVNLLRAGGFELGKWASSSPSLLSSLSADVFHFPDSESSLGTTKILGVVWDPVPDVFCCRIDPTPVPATKRGILSKIARMYDPNGYFSPIMFALKVIIQQLWLLKIEWDQNIPNHVGMTWDSMERELPLLEQIKIPRCILPRNHRDVQLVGFSDASELGMAAVLYLRVQMDDHVQVSLLKSKTKVAPLKPWTIPRLELGAAHLLARLIKASSGLIEFLSISQIICFTDSTNTLAWLRTPPFKLKQFVCNRVISIHELCPTIQWKHVPGKINPADIASRGSRPSKMCDHTLWWRGPPFLAGPTGEWPRSPELNYGDLPEMKPATILSFPVLNTSESKALLALIENASGLLKLQRVVAYVQRFIYNIRSGKSERRGGPISAAEYRDSLRILIRFTQTFHLKDDMDLLKSGKAPSRRIAALSPFISPDGLVMVGGRLTWAPISERAKRPILLPKSSKLAVLMIDYLHVYSAHAGPRLVQSLLHREYWVPSARNLIRQRIQKCVKCARFTATVNQPKMADLPPFRLQPGKCFNHTGVDFGGPFSVRAGHLRRSATMKGYFALFVCMTTRAVHIEVVSALSTDACLAAIDRFIARRGLPSHIYSDNGRNFRGCAREMSEIHDFLKQASRDLETYLAQREVAWVFNPPSAPHFGGAWEILIKGTKHHLKRTIGDRILNFEEFTTVFARIEAILNSRPLVALPGSPDDPADCLTPGHFLVGGPLLARPENTVDSTPGRLQRWQLITQIVQSFWNRWRKEYLHSLQPRSKWTRDAPNLQEGAVVVLKTPNASPTQWPLGRVIQVLPGPDGAVRVARVKTASGVLMRPTNRLVVLPVE